MPCVDIIWLILLMIGFISQAWTFSTNQWLPYKIIITTFRDPWPTLACAIFACVDLWLGCVRVGPLIWSGILQDEMDKFLRPSPKLSSYQESKEKEKHESRLTKQKQYDSTKRFEIGLLICGLLTTDYRLSLVCAGNEKRTKKKKKKTRQEKTKPPQKRKEKRRRQANWSNKRTIFIKIILFSLFH